MGKILAVDDSLSIRNMIELTLDETDHDITTAEDGLIAFEKLRSEKFDLIITDINMPNMGGYELIEQIRQLAEYKATPIICVTTESAKDQISKAREIGATGWLIKPFSPEKLIGVVGKLI